MLKDKIKVGDYVRTKYGIAKYISDKATRVTIYKVIDKDIVYDNVDGWEDVLLDNEIIKSSPNIIDLIEIGDYVNGGIVINKKNDTIQIIQLIIPFDLKEKDIKSIVTKEQFESMEYKIER